MPLLLLDTVSGQPNWLEAAPSTPAPVAMADWIAAGESAAVVGDVVGLTTADDPQALVDVLQDIERIDIVFDDINDGRGFSIGRRLREMGFTGEIRATGRILQDQLHYLVRCGFNAFELPEGTQEHTVVNLLKPFSIRYQSLLHEAAPRILTTQSPAATPPAEATIE